MPCSESITDVEYRIAYIALCIEDGDSGRELFDDLRKIPEIDLEYVQFGCADWFWERQVNSYALQVEPRRYMNEDKAFLDYQEALHLEKIKSEFFRRLREVVKSRL